MIPKTNTINLKSTIHIWYGYCKKTKFKGFSGKTINFNLIY